MSVQKKILNGFNIYYYDSEWQKPVITEENVFKLFMKNENLPNNYLAFPWANMIDRIGNLYDKIKDVKINDSTCFTVVQHISFRNFLELFSKIGITHIFSPHRSTGDGQLEKDYNINIIPFSLFPVQSNQENIININERKYLSSFIGQYNKRYYLTDIRQKIFDIFSNFKDNYIVRRKEWHYDGMVYRNKKDTNKTNEEEYKDVLRESKFSLCPSGSGPNSIRIWESMSYGSIPVILADTLVLPEIQNVDWNDYFIIWKENSIDKLYDYLINFQKDKLEEMSNKNIQLYNKFFSFDNMEKIILEYYKK
jgi:hypothetical protein